MNKNIHCYLMYLHISLKINYYFYKKIIMVVLSKFDEMLDFQILAFKMSVNQITFHIMYVCNY